MVGILVSFWDGLFSGATFVSRSVGVFFQWVMALKVGRCRLTIKNAENGLFFFANFNLSEERNKIPRWWFRTFFMFTPNPGEDEPILTHIFQRGWFNHQPDPCHTNQ